MQKPETEVKKQVLSPLSSLAFTALPQTRDKFTGVVFPCCTLSCRLLALLQVQMVPVNNMTKIKVTVEEYVKGETQTSEVGSVSSESVYAHVYTCFACVPATPA